MWQNKKFPKNRSGGGGHSLFDSGGSSDEGSAAEQALASFLNNQKLGGSDWKVLRDNAAEIAILWYNRSGNSGDSGQAYGR